ncbi:MAG TPA: N-succinylarginine dihydrolase [Tepidisphaeraceae bacterium]|nr:N-succinylarginine dihydrolase [Tepidisphaeraceae bacterium]
MIASEVNFDGIVGPTHHYAGLSHGNVASMTHKKSISNPKQAALQGLAKMRLLLDLGLTQVVLPPHERPDLKLLRNLGFSGSDAAVLEQAYRTDPAILSAASSASSMWTANAATVSPSSDCADDRVHFTPANLISNLHRSIESSTTARVLKAIFPDESKFAHHDPLSPASQMGDEGAANHTRLCENYDAKGIEIFTYGRVAGDSSLPGPKRFPARQTLEASQAIARLHQLDPANVIFVQQNPDAIDAGAFHNDVVCVGNQNVLFFHERAFVESPALQGRGIIEIKVTESQIPLPIAISTYLFNSQLITLPNHSMMLIAPTECEQNQQVRDFLNHLLSQATPIKSMRYVDVRQSMSNGGGPACLRLRVVLREDQLAAINQAVLFTPTLHEQLKSWVEKHYRDTLQADDLRDPQLLKESRDALAELSALLRLGPIYDFQK